MTYIVNFCANQGCAICNGTTQLAMAINDVHRSTNLWIDSIVPVNYCRYLYAAYEFDSMPMISKPFQSNKLQEVIKFISSEGGRLLAIYEFTPQVHPVV